ncbi:MAG: transposase, partial [Pseudomonadota bacterium]
TSHKIGMTVRGAQIPERSVLENHWAGARNKKMKGALTLFAQDSGSKLILHTDADIKKSESDDQVLEFLSFWQKVRRGVNPTLVFASKCTSGARLSLINAEYGVKFITLRRRGKNLVDNVDGLDGWGRKHIPHEKRKYPNPQVHESFIELRGYAGKLCQIIIRGKDIVEVHGHTFNVIYPGRAHNPILRQVPWNNLPLPALGETKITLNFG